MTGNSIDAKVSFSNSKKEIQPQLKKEESKQRSWFPGWNPIVDQIYNDFWC